jgi:thermitase
MRKLITAGVAAAMMALGGITTAAPGTAAPESAHVAGQILVKFRDDRAAAGVLRQHGLSDGPGVGSTGARLIKVPAGKELQLISALSRNPAVEYAEPDEVVTATTDDPYFGRQYALENTGQEFTNTWGTQKIAGGDVGADVDAVDAWTVTQGGDDTRVAIIDSGVAINHEDISQKVVARANFSDTVIREGNPDDIEKYDKYGHGTHVAGIVAAAHNTVGVAGVCPDCTILDAKVLNDTGSGSTSSIANGINWAVKNAAKVINMSLGQRVSNRTLEAAVNNAWNAGVLIVAAAGNGGTQAKVYPGAYPNVIAVAATDNRDEKASFSTYGRWVDVAAPGVNVYSTFPDYPFALGGQNKRANGYDIESGTSMASPIVAAVAALAWSSNPGADNMTVREHVENTTDDIGHTDAYWAHGRVNASKAVRWDQSLR